MLDARKVTYVKVLKEQANQGRDVRHTIPAHLRREDAILEPDNIPDGSKHIVAVEMEVLKCINL